MSRAIIGKTYTVLFMYKTGSEKRRLACTSLNVFATQLEEAIEYTKEWCRRNGHEHHGTERVTNGPHIHGVTTSVINGMAERKLRAAQ